MGQDGYPSAKEIEHERHRQEILRQMEFIEPKLFLEYKRRNSLVLAWTFFAFAVGLLISAFVFGGLRATPFVIPIVGLGALFLAIPAWLIAEISLGPGKIFAEFELKHMKDKVSLETMVKETHSMASETGKKLTELEARDIGRQIIAAAGSNVNFVLGSNNIVGYNIGSVSICNTINQDDGNLKEALEAIIGLVSKSDKKEAPEALNDLSEAIAETPRKPSKIRAFWNELVRIVPEVVTFSKAVAEIKKLFL